MKCFISRWSLNTSQWQLDSTIHFSQMQVWMGDCSFAQRIFEFPALLYLQRYLTGVMGNCCHLGAHSVYTIQPNSSFKCHFIWSYIHRLLVVFPPFQGHSVPVVFPLFSRTFSACSISLFSRTFSACSISPFSRTFSACSISPFSRTLVPMAFPPFQALSVPSFPLFQGLSVPSFPPLFKDIQCL